MQMIESLETYNLKNRGMAKNKMEKVFFMMIVQKRMEVVEALRNLKKNNNESALMAYRQKRREYKQTLRSKKREQHKVRNLKI